MHLSGSNANQNKDILGKPFVETQWGCWSNWRRDDWPCDLKCHAGNIPTTSNSTDTDCLNTYVMVMNVFGYVHLCSRFHFALNIPTMMPFYPVCMKLNEFYFALTILHAFLI